MLMRAERRRRGIAVHDANRGKRADDDGEPALALCLHYRAQAKLGCRCS